MFRDFEAYHSVDEEEEEESLVPVIKLMDRIEGLWLFIGELQRKLKFRKVVVKNSEISISG